MIDLKKKKLFLLDMDGTIYIENDLFDGTIDFLEYVRAINGRYIFLTNNSSKGVGDYINKMNKLGIETEEDDFITSVNVTAMYLAEKQYKMIYVAGTESFKRQLTEAGLPITDKLCDEIDCLCLGFDTEITFKKIEDACILLNRNIAYVATNPDIVCPTWYGYVPDCGSITSILYNATKRKPVVIGKPQAYLAEYAMKKTGFTKDETVIIGDRLYTDIACGVNAGISSVFVLSGEGTLDDIKESEVKPDFVFSNIKEFYERLKNENNAKNKI